MGYRKEEVEEIFKELFAFFWRCLELFLGGTLLRALVWERPSSRFEGNETYRLLNVLDTDLDYPRSRYGPILNTLFWAIYLRMGPTNIYVELATVLADNLRRRSSLQTRHRAQKASTWFTIYPFWAVSVVSKLRMLWSTRQNIFASWVGGECTYYCGLFDACSGCL